MIRQQKKALAFLTIAVLLLLGMEAAASGLATSSRQYLKIPFGVRPAALAGSFVGLADDHNAVHWNPAGLVQVMEPEVDLMYLSYFADMNFFYGAVALPTDGPIGLGASIIYGWLEPFNSTADGEAEPGTFSDLAATFGAGYRRGSLAVGGAVKYLHSSLMHHRSMGVGLDLGAMLFMLDGRCTAGFAATNVFSFLSSYGEYQFTEKLPTDLKAGVAYRFRRRAPNRFTLSLEVNRPLDSYLWIHGGGEVVIKDILSLRGGYKFREHGLDLGGLSGFSCGGGLRQWGVNINYALAPFGDLGNTHYISLTYRFLPLSHEPMIRRRMVEEPRDLVVQRQTGGIDPGAVSRAEFNTRSMLADQEMRMDIKAWELDITDADGRVVRTMRGSGKPPEKLVWDGKDDKGGVVVGGVMNNYKLRISSDREMRVVKEGSLFAASMGEEGTRQTKLRRIPEERLRPDKRGRIKVPPVYFDSRSSQLSPRDLYMLRQVANIIRKNPKCKIYIEGHSSPEGAFDYNLGLSQARANAVLRYLIEVEKVNLRSVLARGHGSTMPKFNNTTPTGRRRNRRVEVILVVE